MASWQPLTPPGAPLSARFGSAWPPRCWGSRSAPACTPGRSRWRSTTSAAWPCSLPRSPSSTATFRPPFSPLHALPPGRCSSIGRCRAEPRGPRQTGRANPDHPGHEPGGLPERRHGDHRRRALHLGTGGPDDFGDSHRGHAPVGAPGQSHARRVGNHAPWRGARRCHRCRGRGGGSRGRTGVVAQRSARTRPRALRTLRRDDRRPCRVPRPDLDAARDHPPRRAVLPRRPAWSPATPLRRRASGGAVGHRLRAMAWTPPGAHGWRDEPGAEYLGVDTWHRRWVRRGRRRRLAVRLPANPHRKPRHLSVLPLGVQRIDPGWPVRTAAVIARAASVRAPVECRGTIPARIPIRRRCWRAGWWGGGAAARPDARPRRIEIVIHYSGFGPTDLTVPHGVPITFVLINGDPIDHEWLLGDIAFQARHRTGTEPFHGNRPTEVSLPPPRTAEATLTFDAPGTLPYIFHLPGHE